MCWVCVFEVRGELFFHNEPASLVFHHCIVYSRLSGPGVSSHFSLECLPSHHRLLGSQLWSPHPDFNVGAEVQIQFIRLVLQVLLPAEPSIPPQANHFLYTWTPSSMRFITPSFVGRDRQHWRLAVSLVKNGELQVQ